MYYGWNYPIGILHILSQEGPDSRNLTQSSLYKVAETRIHFYIHLQYLNRYIQTEICIIFKYVSDYCIVMLILILYQLLLNQQLGSNAYSFFSICIQVTHWFNFKMINKFLILHFLCIDIFGNIGRILKMRLQIGAEGFIPLL